MVYKTSYDETQDDDYDPSEEYFRELYERKDAERAKAGAKRAEAPPPPDEDEAPEPEPEPSQGSLTTTTTSCAVLLAKPNILGKFDGVLQRKGVVGERRAGRLVYLAGISRLMPSSFQVSVITKAQSSTGKSYLVLTVFEFFEEGKDFLYFSAISPMALAYYKQRGARNLRNKTIVIGEASGIAQGDGATMLRQLVSEGRLCHRTVIKGKGVELRVEGPVNVVITTTAVEVDGELETRALTLRLDESAEQTRAVMQARARKAMNPTTTKVDLSEWHKLQRWLAKEGEKRVVVPFAEALVSFINANAVRWRRDIATILNLIAACAMLHQKTRERDSEGCVVASLDDYAIVRELVDDLLAEGTGVQVSKPIREIVEFIKKKTSNGGCTQTQITAGLKKHKSTISRQVREGVAGGWLKIDENGAVMRDAPLPEEGNGVLPEVEELYNRCKGSCK